MSEREKLPNGQYRDSARAYQARYYRSRIKDDPVWRTKRNAAARLYRLRKKLQA